MKMNMNRQDGQNGQGGQDRQEEVRGILMMEDYSNNKGSQLIFICHLLMLIY